MQHCSGRFFSINCAPNFESACSENQKTIPIQVVTVWRLVLSLTTCIGTLGTLTGYWTVGGTIWDLSPGHWSFSSSCGRTGFFLVLSFVFDLLHCYLRGPPILEKLFPGGAVFPASAVAKFCSVYSSLISLLEVNNLDVAIKHLPRKIRKYTSSKWILIQAIAKKKREKR